MTADVTGVAYTSALVLAAVFAWAAVGKLRAPVETAAGFEGLRLPGSRVLARLVPAAELTLAGALVVWPLWGATVALGLLAAFTIVIVRNVGRATTGCNCFGATPRDTPVSTVDVIRNLLLAAAAVVATAASRPVVPGLADAVIVAVAVAIAAIGLRNLRQ